MNAIAYISVFLFSTIAVSQTNHIPAGRYQTPLGYSVHIFEIDSIGQFTGTLHNCGGSALSKGRVLIYNNQLFIHYSDTVCNRVEISPMNIETRNIPDSIHVVLRLFSQESGIPLSNYHVEFYSRNNENNRTSGSTDEQGVIEYILPLSSEPYKCFIRKEDIYNFSFSIPGNQNTSSEVFLTLSQLQPLNSSHNIRFKIRAITEEALILLDPKYDQEVVLHRVNSSSEKD